jgi:type II secretory pathway component PulF
MKKFEFRGFDKEGNFKVGIIEAVDKETAIKILHNQNLVVTYIKELSELRPLITWGGVSLLDLAFFYRALNYLLKAGTSLDEAVKSLASQTNKLSFKRVLEDVYNNIISGLPLSQSLEKHTNIFEKSATRLIRIGELSGNLEEVLENLAKHYENQHKFRTKLIQSMYYPAIVLLIFLVTMFVLFFNVIPKIANLFKENNLTLPLVTQYFVMVSEFLVNNGIYVLLFLIFLIYVIIEYFKSEEGKLLLYNFLANMPVFGVLLKEIQILNILESISYLIKGGLPISESLKIVGESITNPYYKSAVLFIAEETEKGKPISLSISNFPDLFPGLVQQAFATGERTGNLYNSLITIIDYYSADIENRTNNLAEAVQPLMVIILAIGLVFVEMSLLLPISQLARSLSTY